MPFTIYKKIVETGGKIRLVRQNEISLAGKGGPFCTHVMKALEKTPNQNYTWHMGDEDIMRELGIMETTDYSIIIDMKPSVKGNISLYQIIKVWGFTCEEWTPLALQLKPLYVDEKAANPEEFKQSFVYPEAEMELVHEFLYLQGGTKGGKWTWGRVGSVNGVLLWPKVFNYFVECIKPYAITTVNSNAES